MQHSVTRRSRLLRVALWLFIFCAAFFAVWLVLESILFSQSMPDRGMNFQVGRIVGLIVANLVFTALIASIGLLYLWVRLASSLPDLQGWHLQKPPSEFCSGDAGPDYSLDDYLAQEERVFAELDAFIANDWTDQSHGALSRFHSESVCNPETVADRNWNRSYVLPANDPIGGVLLVHGLSDSPYSLRALGQRLHAEGYTVIWLRVPGHGTSPAALANVSCDDWTAAVKLAMRGLRERVPDGYPLFMAGYSNGGALSVDYALSAVEDRSLPRVQAVVLFSPMIGINPMARITRLYHTVALVSGNQKAQWSSIDAEIDPFKFCSWPMNANVQAWSVTQAVENKLAALEKSGRLDQMPPLLAMQSLVDSTVTVPKLITVLFDRSKSKLSQLFLFDINRDDRLSNLFNLSFEKSIFPKLQRTDLPYTLVVLRNADADSSRVAVCTRDGESWTETATDLAWPTGVASLSHIAVPIPPQDSIYGTHESTVASGLSLGSFSIRAEPSALLISNSLFVRNRHNHFYDFMEDRVIDWLAGTTSNS